MSSNDIIQRLAKLREIMQQKNISMWVALTADPHLSEYLPDFWKTREYLSGFTGSAGALVITEQEAYLWTDSRYWVQAEKQLSDTTIKLFKMNNQSPSLWEWCVEQLSENSVLALNGQTLAYGQFRQLQAIAQPKNIALSLHEDLLENIWLNRPELPVKPLFIHDKKFVSHSAQEKIQLIREKMQLLNANYHLLSSLDDIAWITNLRGADVNYNPVFLSHLLISLDEVILFVDQQKINSEVEIYLKTQQITVKDYNKISQVLAVTKIDKLLVDFNKVTYGTLKYLQESTELIQTINPSTILKSRKTSFELNHVREAMVQDGIALCEFFSWLDQSIADKKRLSELDVDYELTKRRSKQNNYVSLSFNTIAGFNANAALPHYAATSQNFAYIEGNGILLIDSGGQYFNGTTDITRVVAINQPNDLQKIDFTCVLKSHIAMSSLIYPEGIKMPLLDAIARAPLWQEQLDFGHGTGHGVGYFLNVHEGPQVLSCYTNPTQHTAVYRGMITSIEPGLYRYGQWGIRIENLVASVPFIGKEPSQYGQFLKFDPLTLCPIDLRLVKQELLTQQEKDWVNAYHQEVRKQLITKVSEKAKSWLENATQFI